eukprot:474860_1
MSDSETDELRKWMESNGVWHKMLYSILSEEEVETLIDFKSLPLLDVMYIIDDAKKAGFAHEIKLKTLHGGFRDTNLKRESIAPKQSSIQSIQIEFKTNAMLQLQDSPINTNNTENESENIEPQKDKIIITKTNSVNSVKPTSKTKKQKSNENIENISKPKPKPKPKKKTSNKSKCKSKPIRRKDSKELKMECRSKMEKYMRENGIWQIDLFDLICDEYKIYSIEELENYKTNKEWVNEFILKAKRCGMMSGQAKQLAIYCGIKKSKKKQRKNKSLMPIKKSKKQSTVRSKSKSTANLTSESLKVMDPKDKENIARNKMEPFMNKNGFWQKDLFLTLLEYDVVMPTDLDQLSKGERKEIIKKAKQRGCMGQKIKKFKAYFA